jgi:hypothetical protein
MFSLAPRRRRGAELDDHARSTHLRALAGGTEQLQALEGI